MGETPSDSGGSPVSAPARQNGAPIEPHEPVDVASSNHAGADFRKPAASELLAQLRRPGWWGLLVLILVTLAIQIWLLFL